MNTQCKTQSSQSQFTCTNTQTQVFCPQITKPPTTQHPRQHFLQYPHPKITNSQRPMIQNGSKPPKQTLIPILPTKYHLDPNTGTNSNNSHKLITLPKKNWKHYIINIFIYTFLNFFTSGAFSKNLREFPLQRLRWVHRSCDDLITTVHCALPH